MAEAPLMEENLSDTVKEAMARIVKEKLEEFGNGNPKTVKDFMGGLMAITDLNELLIQTAGQFPWEYTVKQELLECGYVSHLYDRVVYYLMREIEILKIKRDYQGKVKASIDKNQRELYFLREELKVIQEELGEEYTGSDADSFLEQLEKLNADKETKEKIRKEIMRFKAMPAEARRPTCCGPTSKQCWSFPGKRRPGTTRISAMRKRSWRRTITDWKRSRSGCWNIWQSGS